MPTAVVVAPCRNVRHQPLSVLIRGLVLVVVVVVVVLMAATQSTATYSSLVRVVCAEAATPGAPPQLVISYYFPTPLSDIAFTYSANKGRLQAMALIKQRFPNTELVQLMRLDTNAMTGAQILQSVTSDVVDNGVNLFFFMSNTIVSRIPGGALPTLQNLSDWAHDHTDTNPAATRNPYGVGFVEMNYGRWLASPYSPTSNRTIQYVGTLMGFQSSFFVLGAATGATCAPGRPVGLVIAAAPHMGGVDAFRRGMLRGQRFRKDFAAYSSDSRYGNVTNTTLCPVMAIMKSSFSDPCAEKELAALFRSINASTLLMWADTSASASYLASVDNSMFSITSFVDGTRTIGDSVLSSFILDGRALFFNVTRDYLEGTFLGLADYGLRNRDGELELGRVSSRAPAAAATAMRDAIEYMDEKLSPICAPSVDTSGVVRLAAGSGCMSLHSMMSVYYYEQGIIALPNFVSGATCAAGTYVLRSMHNFSLMACVACAAGTISAERGQYQCRPCGAGFVPNANQTDCIRLILSASSDGAGITAATAVGSIVGGVVVVAVAWYVVIAVRRRNALWGWDAWRAADSTASRVENNSYSYPKGPSVALLLIGVDAEHSVPQWRRSLSNVAVVYESLGRAVRVVCRRYGAYVSLNVGDIYVVAHQSPWIAAEVAAMIHAVFHAEQEQQARISRRPLPHVTLRSLLHVCTPTILPPSRDTLRAQFTGNAVRTAKMLWARNGCEAIKAAKGGGLAPGEMTMSTSTMDPLLLAVMATREDPKSVANSPPAATHPAGRRNAGIVDGVWWEPVWEDQPTSAEGHPPQMDNFVPVRFAPNTPKCLKLTIESKAIQSILDPSGLWRDEALDDGLIELEHSGTNVGLGCCSGDVMSTPHHKPSSCSSAHRSAAHQWLLPCFPQHVVKIPLAQLRVMGIATETFPPFAVSGFTGTTPLGDALQGILSGLPMASHQVLRDLCIHESRRDGTGMGAHIHNACSHRHAFDATRHQQKKDGSSASDTTLSDLFSGSDSSGIDDHDWDTGSAGLLSHHTLHPASATVTGSVGGNGPDDGVGGPLSAADPTHVSRHRPSVGHHDDIIPRPLPHTLAILSEEEFASFQTFATRMLSAFVQTIPDDMRADCLIFLVLRLRLDVLRAAAVVPKKSLQGIQAGSLETFSGLSQRFVTKMLSAESSELHGSNHEIRDVPRCLNALRRVCMPFVAKEVLSAMDEINLFDFLKDLGSMHETTHPKAPNAAS